MALIKITLRDALSNKAFYIANLIGIVIVIYGIWEGLQVYKDTFEYMNADGVAPLTEAFTVFNRWIGGENYSLSSSVYFFLFPILVTMPYGWSYVSEKKSHYMDQVIVRERRWKYYIAKVIGVFVSAGLTMVIPLLVSLLLAAAFYPALTPVVIYDIYTSVFHEDLMAIIYYNNPFIYVTIFLVIDFILAGMIACTTFFFALITKVKLIVILLPFVALVIFDYIKAFFPYTSLQLNPLKMVHPADYSGYLTWGVLLVTILIFSILILGSIVREKTHESI